MPARKQWSIALGLIIMAAVAVRVYWAAGLIPKDDAEFAKVAYEISQGTFDFTNYEGPPVIPVRTGIILPTAASMSLFGPGEVQIAAYPLMTSVLMVILVYLFSLRMFGHMAAVFAATVWIFLPMEIEISTMLYPEVPTTAFAVLGLYCLYMGRKRSDIWGRGRLLYGIAGGLAFGAAWLCKESVVYFVPFCLALILFDLKKTGLRQVPTWLGIAAGSLLVLVGEMMAYAAITGDWLHRFNAIHKNYELYPEFFFTEGSRFGYEPGTPFWKAVIKRVAIDGPAIIFLQPHFLFLPAFGAVAALYGLYRRDDRFYYMGALMAVLVLMFNFFSVSLQNYQPMPLFSRYFYPICVPAVILTGGMVASLVQPFSLSTVWRERPERVFWGGMTILILTAIVGWSTFRQARDWPGTWASAERYLAKVLTVDDRIHTDVISRNALEFFWRYPERMNISVYGEPGQQLHPQCNDYVLNNESYNQWLATNVGSFWAMRGFEAPASVKHPPDNWRVEWTNGNSTLYKIECP